MNRLFSLALVFCFVLAVRIAFAKPPTTQPAARDAAEDEYVISKMRVQEMSSHSFFYKEFETDMAGIGTIAGPTIEEMFRLVEENKVPVRGNVTFIYKGASPDPGKKFKLQIGVIVDDSAVGAGDYQVRKLDTFRCATVIYSGALPNVAKAYQQLFTDLFGAGLTPTDETRETYLMWEGIDSMNNITLIQAGVK